MELVRSYPFLLSLGSDTIDTISHGPYAMVRMLWFEQSITPIQRIFLVVNAIFSVKSPMREPCDLVPRYWV
jgi:hypothetical protein